MFFYVLSISFLYAVSFYFLGLVLVNKQVLSSVGSHPVRTIAVRYTAGVLLNFLVLLAGRDMILARAMYLLLVGAGVVIFCLNQKAERMILRQFFTDWRTVVLALFIVIYGFTIYSTPLAGWDARSIWFFQAKTLYFDHGLFNNPQWHMFQWSHPDYPKLIPFMGAQISFFCGLWNDFLSRTGLLAMLIMCVLWFRRIFAHFGAFLLSLLLVLAIGEFAWNGYMDGYLALSYSVIIALLFVIIKEGDLEDVIGMMVCLGLVANIKNEGILLSACFMLSLIVYLWKFGWASDRYNRRFIIKAGSYALLAFSPMVLWEMYKKIWGINNDLGLFSAEFFSRLSTRANDLIIVTGKILMATLFANLYTYLVVCIFIVFLLLGKSFVKRHARWFSLSMLSFALYYVGIFIIYFSTPMDLNWHLATSAGRIMMPLWLPIAMMLLLFFAESRQPGVQRKP